MPGYSVKCKVPISHIIDLILSDGLEHANLSPEHGKSNLFPTTELKDRLCLCDRVIATEFFFFASFVFSEVRRAQGGRELEYLTP